MSPTDVAQMRADLLRLINTPPAACAGTPDDTLFDDLARRIFRFQFEQNGVYQQFCRNQKKTPETVHHWSDIPPLPVMAFQVADVVCQPVSAAAHRFHSSGTTSQGDGTPRPSRHFLFDPERASAVILAHFGRQIMPDVMPECGRMRLAILASSPAEAPHSSLSFMMETVRLAAGDDESRYYVERGYLQAERLVYDLDAARAPVCLLGTSFSFVHLIDFYARHGFPCCLPAGSRLMDTGGFKGRSREVAREWVYAQAEKLFGIPVQNCVNEYGMTELTSQFYDGVVGATPDDRAPRVYTAPPQMRTRILSPTTLAPVATGEVGLLAHYDLANLDSVAAILTEDLGHAVADGFMLTGRAQGAQERGCSLAWDALNIGEGRDNGV